MGMEAEQTKANLGFLPDPTSLGVEIFPVSLLGQKWAQFTG